MVRVSERRNRQVNFRPSESLLEDLERYRDHMGYRSLSQTVYFLVSEAVDEKLRVRGLKTGKKNKPGRRK